MKCIMTLTKSWTGKLLKWQTPKETNSWTKKLLKEEKNSWTDKLLKRQTSKETNFWTDKLLKVEKNSWSDKLLKRQTPIETNSWTEKLLKFQDFVNVMIPFTALFSMFLKMISRVDVFVYFMLYFLKLCIFCHIFYNF